MLNINTNGSLSDHLPTERNSLTLVTGRGGELEAKQKGDYDLVSGAVTWWDYFHNCSVNKE